MAASPTPPDPNFEDTVRRMFAEQNFMVFLGVRLTDVGPGRAEQRLAFRPEFAQQHDFFHGGLVGTLADNSMGCAAATMKPAGKQILTAEFKVNLIRPANGEELIGRAEVVRAGARLCVCRADVLVVRQGAEIACAVAQGSFMYFD